MILGIGIDLVEVERLARSLARFGDRLTGKLLSARELELMASKAQGRPAWLARQFAAKEAVSKALGTGMKGGVHFRQIEVLRRETGAPFVELQGRARQRAADLGVQAMHISITDEKRYAIAYAVAED